MKRTEWICDGCGAVEKGDGDAPPERWNTAVKPAAPSLQGPQVQEGPFDLCYSCMNHLLDVIDVEKWPRKAAEAA